MPLPYTHMRGVHAEHSSRPGQGDSARSVKLKLLLQTARLVYMQGDEDEVGGSNERQSQISSRICFLLHMRVLNVFQAQAVSLLQQFLEQTVSMASARCAGCHEVMLFTHCCG